MKSIYLAGSLRNPLVPIIGNKIRELGIDVFDDWFAGGKHADDEWRDYEKARGHTYDQSLKGWAAKHIFEFDKHHLDRTDGLVMVMPAGKSSHLELGYTIGKGKPGFVLFDAVPERYDVMYQFATGVFFNVDDLIKELSYAVHKSQSKTEKRTVDTP